MKLVRDDQTADRTYGTLQEDDGTVLCQTFEWPWADNQHGISCIPAGTYTAFRFDSPHLGYTLFQLRDVPGRSGIDIHIGNRLRDTEGCVLLGVSRGTLDGEDAVLGSRTAFAAFMAHNAGIDSFLCEVIDP